VSPLPLSASNCDVSIHSAPVTGKKEKCGWQSTDSSLALARDGVHLAGQCFSGSFHKILVHTVHAPPEAGLGIEGWLKFPAFLHKFFVMRLLQDQDQTAV